MSLLRRIQRRRPNLVKIFPRIFALAGESIEVPVVEDCWVAEVTPDTNKNGKGLGIGRDIKLNRSLLTFDLSNLDITKDEIGEAELRLYGRAVDTPAKIEVYYTHGFQESLVTWTTQPPPVTLHWDGEGSLMGSLSDIPTVEGWISIPLTVVFLQEKWDQNINILLKGDEGPSDSYCYTDDREKGGTEFAPRLIIWKGTPPEPPPPELIVTKTELSNPTEGQQLETETAFMVDGYLTRTDENRGMGDRLVDIIIDDVRVSGERTDETGYFWHNHTFESGQEGNHTIKASYEGSSLFEASSDSVTVTVKTGPTPPPPPKYEVIPKNILKVAEELEELGYTINWLIPDRSFTVEGGNLRYSGLKYGWSTYATPI